MFIPKGIEYTGAQYLWNQGYTGKNIKIGVIDTGIDSNHIDLKNVSKSITFIKEKEPIKLNPHGTQVAGIISSNGILRGMAPNSILNDYKIVGDSINQETSDLCGKAVIHAVDDGCDIINMSLGWPDPNINFKNALDYARIHDVLIVVEGGNNEIANINWKNSVFDYSENYTSNLVVSSLLPDQFEKLNFFNNNLSNKNLFNKNFSIDNNVNEIIDSYVFGKEVISLLPNDQIGVIENIYLSCPIVTGFAALILEKNEN